jgi:signal transduction histidine kinase
LPPLARWVAINCPASWPGARRTTSAAATISHCLKADFGLVHEDETHVVRAADDGARRTGYGAVMQRVHELWQTDRGRLVHYVVAVALAIFLVVEFATLEDFSGDPVEPYPGLIVLAVIGAIGLLFSRDAPFIGPLVTAGALGLAVELSDAQELQDTGAPFVIAILFLPWCLATYNEPRRAIVGLVAMELLGAWVNVRWDGSFWDYFFIGTFMALSWTVGFVLSRRAAQARELGERAARLEQEHQEAASRAVAAERQRIARELHDVVAHSVSVMTVQAGAVRRLLRPDQETERRALETVEATGREALTEMRRLVGLLREQGAMPEFSPQPGLGTMNDLLETVRSAGLPVELNVDGTPRELPPGMDLAAYRVVQEALTNALKYGGTAHAWVSLRWHEDELELEVANDGKGDGDGSGGGHGLAGMRERVSLYGGTVHSGPRDGGGYVVRARLPVTQT